MNKLAIAAALALLLIAPGCNQTVASGGPGTGAYASDYPNDSTDRNGARPDVE